MDIAEAIKIHRIAAQKMLTDEALKQLQRMQKAINAVLPNVSKEKGKELHDAWKSYQGALANLLVNSRREE